MLQMLLAPPVIHEQDKFFELKLQLLKIIKLFQIGYCSYNTKTATSYLSRKVQHKNWRRTVKIQ